MSRSIKKGPYVDTKLAKKVVRMEQANNREAITTWARACTITPDFVGHTFMVHNGKKHVKVHITEDMVGHKLGGIRSDTHVPWSHQQEGSDQVTLITDEHDPAVHRSPPLRAHHRA